MDALTYPGRMVALRRRAATHVVSFASRRGMLGGTFNARRIRRVPQQIVVRSHRRLQARADSTEEFPEERSLVSASNRPVLELTTDVTEWQAPSKPQTAFGEMLTYYLKMEPQLFKSALEDKLKALNAEASAARLDEETKKLDVEKNTETMDLTLSKCERTSNTLLESLSPVC